MSIPSHTNGAASPRLQGVIAPMVTPLAGDDRLDTAGLARLVERLVSGGVHGVFVLGTTGEGPSLSYKLRQQMIDEACRLVDRRVPVLVGVTDTSLAESIHLASYAQDAGADCVVLAPPCYFPIDQPDLLRWTEALADQSRLPVCLYNMPVLTKTVFEPETVARLMEHPNIIGLKDSSGDLDYFAKLRDSTRSRADWSLLTGPEHLLGHSVKLGGDGGVCGGANVFPQLFVKLYEAARADDDATVVTLETRVARLDRIYRVGPNPSLAVIQGIKAALAALGVCEDRLAAPFQRLATPAREQVRAVVESMRDESAALDESAQLSL